MQLLNQSLRDEIDLDQKRKYLKLVPYFSKLSDSMLLALIRQLTVKVFLPGEIVLNNNEYMQNFYVVKQGVL